MDAEIVVSALIEKLQSESTMVHHQYYPKFKKKVQTSIEYLQWLKRCLEVIEDHQASSGLSLNDQRTAQLLKAVYSAEDAADTLQLTREVFQTRRNSGFQWPNSITSLCNQFIFIHQLKKFKQEIREYLSFYDHLVTPIRGSSQNDNKARQNQQHHQQQRWGRVSDFCLEETDVIGLKGEMNELENLLSEDRPSQLVIAVVGDRGSGKTTLVKSVYNSPHIKRKFSGYAWVSVPSLSRVRDVLAEILKQIDEIKLVVEATLSEEEVLKELLKKLKGNSYLIVMEDVDQSPQVLEALGLLLRSSIKSDRIINGDRIIFTTRNKDVALATAGSILNIHPLNNEESWELFLNKVRKSDVFLEGSGLFGLKEQILKLCGGLPLRIVLLGGLLSSKEPSHHEWSRVIEHADEDILALSYQDLASQVKPCFLYMGLFPRGFEIPVRRLIHLWISEGFVTMPMDVVPETIPEDLADMYFKELVIRNMIQVRCRLNGRPKTCWMPSGFYDIFSPEAAEVGFFNNRFQSSHSSSGKQPPFAPRRLATRLGMKNYFRSLSLHVENLHSYIAFETRIPGRPAMEIGMFLKKIIAEKRFGLLKVLDLEGVYKPVLPDVTIGKMLLLNYLGLRSTAINSLPSSVANLRCLETLDLKHTFINDLPAFIWDAKKLRHLYLSWSCTGNFSSSQLPASLHTLWGLSISDDGVGFIKMLSTGLRKLGLTCTSTTVAKATAEWVSQSTKLESLKLRSMVKESYYRIFDLELPNMKMHHNLQELYLLGKISETEWNNVEFPPNLRMLTLSQSELTDDPMPVLGKLPHLRILRFFGDSYSGRMTCPRGGFPELLVLKLWSLRVGKLTVEEGAMPCLREIEIRRCRHLDESTGLQHLTSLRKVVLMDTGLTGSDFLVGGQERNLYIYERD